jgi:hypothetical protein
MSDCGYQQLSVNWKPVSKLLRFWGFAEINKVMPSSSDGRLILYQTKVKTLGYQTNKIKVEGHFTNIWFVSDGDFRGRKEEPILWAIVNQHPPAHRPLDALY